MDAEVFRLPIVHTTADGEEITIRLILPSDSFAEMTALLHRSYKPLADMGLRFWQHIRMKPSPKSVR
ncbi:MAG: hypothetical protein IPM69_03810 [Ignavibacteria bacterium]|nr:hypothetical protein [Ignavibacteria bacterium]